jgi:RHS repeat-associated protein
VIEERDQNNNVTRYNYGDDLIRLDRTSGAYYYIYDGLGSTRQLTDSTGNIVNFDTYDAYGNLLASSTNTIFNSFLFNGQEQDFTGLYYLRARYMDSTRGEFDSQDPIHGSDEAIVTLHKYLYASDQPINHFDQSGREDLAELVSVEADNAILDGSEDGATSEVKSFAKESIENSTESLNPESLEEDFTSEGESADEDIEEEIGTPQSTLEEAEQQAEESGENLTSNQKGKLGEKLAKIKKNNESIEVNGRNRIPDEFDKPNKVVGEVKYVKYQHLSTQIKDSMQLAKDLGGKFKLYVRGPIDDPLATTLSGPLQQAMTALGDAGEIIWLDAGVP